MKKRRRARELCLRILYQLDIQRRSTQKFNLKSQMEDFWKSNPAPSDIQSFATQLSTGTYKHIKEIDSIIERFCENWSLNRISVVDKNIMRCAVYEMLYENDIPPNVTINEAIEIAKKYGSEDSGQFVNGVLDRIKRELKCDKNKDVKN
ncbi:MAG: transcription antitermination factor NusB [Nitrospinae bacterium]|nr:transcription antitermination factor NusB [Nitrospinota bacterium]